MQSTTGRTYKIISADSHTLEPPDLWEKWLEKKYLDTAPKLVEDKDGGHAWIYMGATTPEPLGLVTCVGTHPEELKWTGARYGKPTNPAAREIHPGCYLGDKRLELMDDRRRRRRDPLPAAARHAHVHEEQGRRRAPRRHPRLQPLAQGRLLRARSRAPDRHLPDAERRHRDQRSQELERAKKEGYKGVALSAWPSGGDNLRPDDDPFWDAAAAARHAGLDPPAARRAAGQDGRVEQGQRRDRRVVAHVHHADPRRADLPGRLRPLPEAAGGVRRGRLRLDPALPRDGRRPLLAEPALDEHQGEEGAEPVLQGPLPRDLHHRPQRRRRCATRWASTTWRGRPTSRTTATTGRTRGRRSTTSSATCRRTSATRSSATTRPASGA